MSDSIDAQFSANVRKARREFLETILPFRRDLHAYCRALTGDVWDAEDLVQDVLMKAFAKLADVHWDVTNPRAYVFRMASNLWIDRTRKKSESPTDDLPESEAPAANDDETRAALRELAVNLPPRERAVILLKDVFDFSLADTATFLTSTVAAVKSALHRARTKLASAQSETPTHRVPTNAPDEETLQAWCKAFNARDLNGLSSLMSEDAEAWVVGMVQEYGRDQIRDGSMEHTINDKEGDPEARIVEWHGELLVLLWYKVGGERRVRDVLRFTEDEGGLASMRYYYFCPETLTEICNALNVPLTHNAYWYGGTCEV